ncbi:MAG: autotransporter outer membrane beta-barrel domain-containing protein [Verrucomicrobiaceae bacterium]|nr:autotransporter outer membrane beta-barrel domain-containing protein [Verrucomicrobiaceae bacterium]
MFLRYFKSSIWRNLVAIFFVAMDISLCAYAQDYYNEKNLLDTLVEHRILTEQDALQTRKLMVNTSDITMQKSLVKSFNLGAYTQFRYQFSHQKATEGNIEKTRTANGETIRRVIFLYNAHFNDTSNMIVVLNLVEPSPFDSFYFKKTVDLSIFKGAIHFGVMKPEFNMEYTAAAKLKVPERSIVNSFWGGKDVGYDDYYHESKPNQCLAGNHLGLYWRGNMPFDERIIYGLSITNAKNAYWYKLEQDLELAYWWNIGYAVKNDKHDFQAGLNFGYTPNASSAYDSNTHNAVKCECIGSVAYFIYQGENLFIQGEFAITTSEHGKTMSDEHAVYTTDSRSATPFGAFLILGYAFDLGSLGIFEPICRYSYIDTDGAGISENNVIYSIKKSLNGYYNKVDSYYVGFNWYLDKQERRNWKIATGLEYYHFYDSPTSIKSKSCNVSAFITQLQILF